MGGDVNVVNAARVSFAKQHDEFQESDKSLINYLAKHNHWSPFAHCFFSFRIKAPIFVARQLVKHQVGLAWNEVSRRYVDDEPEFFFPKEWRGKPVNAKQGSSGTLEDQEGWTKDFVNKTKYDLMNYQAAIEHGMAPEQARMGLPQNTMTEWIWSGSLMAFARVCKQRLDSHAQLETQEVAKEIERLISATGSFKHSWAALMDNNN